MAAAEDSEDEGTGVSKRTKAAAEEVAAEIAGLMMQGIEDQQQWIPMKTMEQARSRSEQARRRRMAKAAEEEAEQIIQGLAGRVEEQIVEVILQMVEEAEQQQEQQQQ